MVETEAKNVCERENLGVITTATFAKTQMTGKKEFVKENHHHERSLISRRSCLTLYCAVKAVSISKNSDICKDIIYIS